MKHETFFHSTAVVFPDCTIGKNCRIGAGAVIGSLGISVERAEDKTLKRIPARGSVIIEDHVDIGANCVVHRGVEGDTIIGKGSFIGPMCNIGHNVKIGRNCLIINASILCGWVEIGDNVRINPGTTIKNRVKVGDNAVIGIGSLVLHDVPHGTTVIGRPAVEIEKFRLLRRCLKKIMVDESIRYPCNVCGKEKSVNEMEFDSDCGKPVICKECASKARS